MYDAAVIGGGILGCTTALHLALGGMRVALVERRRPFMEASGVNAGTLSMQNFARPEVVPYALKGWEMWRTAGDWLGADVGFAAHGGLVLAFTEAEGETLEAKVAANKAAGSPVEIVGPDRAREIEPGLSDHPVLTAHCPLDGHANPAACGLAFRGALAGAGVALLEGTAVETVERDGGFAVLTSAGRPKARRLVLAGGVWLAEMVAWFGLHAPVTCRVQQVVVTERMGPVMRSNLGVPNGRLSVKQVDNGTVLIGGGWIGKGDPERGGHGIIPQSLLGNIRLARHAIPALGGARVVRAWLGLRDVYPDDRPLIGPLPGVKDAFMIGCGIGGFTMGPYLGLLLAEHILGREPEMPLFDPAGTVTDAQ